VMRAEKQISAFELRIGSVNYPDDVAGELRADDLVIGVQVEAELDALEGEGLEWLLLRGLFFSLGVFDFRAAEEKFKETVRRRHVRRNRMVQSLRGGEIRLLDPGAAARPGSAALPPAESASRRADAPAGRT